MTASRPPLPGGRDLALIVFSGLPGTGKTTLAEATATKNGLPVLSVAWILGALAPFGVLEQENRGQMAYSLLTMLIDRHLHFGHGLIVDGMVGDDKTRITWRRLARRGGARFLPIECVMTDPALHRQRVEGRTESIPGWPRPDWEHVEEVRARYWPWSELRLVVDAAASLGANLSAVQRYLDSTAGTSGAVDIPEAPAS